MLYSLVLVEASLAQVVSSIPTQKNVIFNVFLSSLWLRAKAQRCVPLNIQFLQKLENESFFGNGEF